MSILQRKLRRCVRAWRRFSRETRAATAVEFGLVAAPFLALLVAILQTTLVMMAQSVLQEATTQASRLIMTGQVQNGDVSQSTFKQDVCNDAAAMFSCGQITVVVQTYSSFSSPPSYVSGGTFTPPTPANSWSPGGPGAIEVVQVFYPWPVFLAPLGFNLSNLTGNQMLLIGTAAFRNEPY
jgi:Flp pilus assembly protein TadG